MDQDPGTSARSNPPTELGEADTLFSVNQPTSSSAFQEAPNLEMLAG